MDVIGKALNQAKDLKEQLNIGIIGDPIMGGLIIGFIMPGLPIMPIGDGEGDIGFIIGDGDPIIGGLIIGFIMGEPIIGLGLPIMGLGDGEGGANGFITGGDPIIG